MACPLSLTDAELLIVLQDFTTGLQARVDLQDVDTSALSALLALLATKDPAPKHTPNYAWIAGPVIGGVAGLAVVIGIIWWLHKRNNAARIPVSFNATGTDAAVRIRRVADKYAVPPQEQGPTSDGGTPTSAAQQVRLCSLVLDAYMWLQLCVLYDTSLAQHSQCASNQASRFPNIFTKYELARHSKAMI
jgi:hypothetical protein